MNEPTGRQQTRILILTVRHGATHAQIARVMEKAIRQLRPDVCVETIDALAKCRPLFRSYYDSFEVVMKYWPALWEHIETRQSQGQSSSPAWLFRWGAKPLFQYFNSFEPTVIVATEVGLCEMAVLHKRQTQAGYRLVGIGALDFERPWAQPEVDLFISSPGEIADQLKLAGVAPGKIVDCGMPVDPSFGPSPDRLNLRASLGLERGLPALLVNFGGSGRMKPRQVVRELRRVQHPCQMVFIARRDEKLRADLLQYTSGMPHARVLPWVDNMHEWMAAADILVSRAGSCTVSEALNCGLPMLVFDAPPGSERRVCELLEKTWRTACWARRPDEISAQLDKLLNGSNELERLRRNSAEHSYPAAAREAAQAIVNLHP